MKKAKKIALIAALAMVIAGGLIVLFTFAAAGFDGGKLLDTYETAYYDFDEDFSSIQIEHDDCYLTIRQSKDEKYHVAVGNDNSQHRCEVTAEGDNLSIKQHNDRPEKWYEYLLLKYAVNDGYNQIDLYIPENRAGDLKLKGSNLNGDILSKCRFGDVEISFASGDVDFKNGMGENLIIDTAAGEIDVGGAEFENIKLSSTSGDIELKDTLVHKSVEITGVSGDMDIENLDCESLVIKTVSGDVEIDKTQATALIKADTTSGNIDIEAIDAPAINLDSISGNVEGSLLTGKIFNAQSVSGEVKLPRSGNGDGSCDVTTKSGNIYLEIDRDFDDD